MPTCTCCPPPIRRTRAPTRADADQRAHMLELAVAGEAGPDRGPPRTAARGPVLHRRHAARTARRSAAPHAPLVWLVGADSLLAAATPGIAGANCSTRPPAGGAAARRADRRRRAGARVRPRCMPNSAPRWRLPAQLHALPAGGFARVAAAPSRAGVLDRAAPPHRRRRAAGATGCRRRWPHYIVVNGPLSDAQPRDADGFTPAGRERSYNPRRLHRASCP